MSNKAVRRKTVLVTAGNTFAPMDKVRGISNIFKGRTGAAIAYYFATQGYEVTLLTSSPELAKKHRLMEVIKYKTFEDLLRGMGELICTRQFDMIIHSAAVSDYTVDQMYEMVGDPVKIDGQLYLPVKLLDRSGKISSDIKRLIAVMIQTDKIVDLIREPWDFRGKLVKFKLQVGMTGDELIQVATRSMHHSEADFIVANTLERSAVEAFIIDAKDDSVTQVSRRSLPKKLLEAITQ